MLSGSCDLPAGGGETSKGFITQDEKRNAVAGIPFLALLGGLVCFDIVLDVRIMPVLEVDFCNFAIGTRGGHNT